MPFILDTPLVSTEWLARHCNEPDIRILDCTLLMKPNEDGSYGFVSGFDQWSEGHIPNSIYINVSDELSDPGHEFTLMMPATKAFADTMRNKGIGDNTAVICYDHGNHAWAARVWWMLRVCGFDNAAVLDGGWKKWLAEKREVSTRATGYTKAEKFTVTHRPELMVDKLTVKAACDDDKTLLLHSLPLPMFKGEVSPYQRAGRISGSKNLFCESLINPDTNTYLEKATLAEKFAPLACMEKDRVITYCGGGIAASANALALTLLGHENVAVYDGSLTEWTADPDLPMETDAGIS